MLKLWKKCKIHDRVSTSWELWTAYSRIQWPDGVPKSQNSIYREPIQRYWFWRCLGIRLKVPLKSWVVECRVITCNHSHIQVVHLICIAGRLIISSRNRLRVVISIFLLIMRVVIGVIIVVYKTQGVKINQQYSAARQLSQARRFPRVFKKKSRKV